MVNDDNQKAGEKPSFEEAIQLAIERMCQLENIDISSLVGVTDDEIVELENKVSLPLPAAYKIFMKMVGKDSGPFLVGTDFLYPEVKLLNDQARNLLDSCNTSFRMSCSQFVFVMHQGYSFLYFDAKDGENPAVSCFSEDMSNPEIVASSFVNWVDLAVGGKPASIFD